MEYEDLRRSGDKVFSTVYIVLKQNIYLCTKKMHFSNRLIQCMGTFHPKALSLYIRNCNVSKSTSNKFANGRPPISSLQ